MMNKFNFIRNNWKEILVFISSFIFCFIMYYVLGAVYCDEVWVYGFSFNLADGLMIYRDYNVVTTPLYFMIASLFIKVFGNYIIITHIFDSLLLASMFVMIFKMIKWKYLILLPIFMFFWPSGYNLLCLFFLILIIYLIHIKKDNDYLIAFIVGLCFITKQNIGVLLLIPTIFYSKNKIKSICCFLVPFLVLSCWLWVNNAFFEFINYCFLGMLEFGNSNLYYDLIFLVLFIVIIISCFYFLIKSKFKNKKLFYVLMFQLIMYPIFDARHFSCILFSVLFLILEKVNNKNILFLLGFTVCFFEISLLIVLYDTLNINLNKNSFDYMRSNGELHLLAEEVKKKVEDSEYFYFTDYYNYYIKLYYDIPIGQYDLLLSGNVGYNGLDKKFNELSKLCKTEKCYFFVQNDGKYLVYQYSRFYDYIISNYEKVDNLLGYDIYSNKNT